MPLRVAVCLPPSLRVKKEGSSSIISRSASNAGFWRNHTSSRSTRSSRWSCSLVIAQCSPFQKDLFERFEDQVWKADVKKLSSLQSAQRELRVTLVRSSSSRCVHHWLV